MVYDHTGKFESIWFNQPYLDSYLKEGVEVILYGKVERRGAILQMHSPEFELFSENEALGYGRVVPVYSVPQGLGQRSFRKFIKGLLDEFLLRLNEFLPFDIRSRNNLLNLAKSLLNIHFPESFELQKEAFKRLCFEEFFLFQILLVLRKARKKDKLGIKHKVNGSLTDNFEKNLPFLLTEAQKQAISEIAEDMLRPVPMQRLLQGDVGSGKTIVAVFASLMAIQGGYQVILMVPTEILAKQHYEKIKSQISKVKSLDKEVRIGLLTSSLEKKEKEKLYNDASQGNLDLIIGTHALLEEGLKLKKLGLLVIDEQHKFGVGQRALLLQKGVNPDVLIMTATPIPRTLAITLYGDLDISVINQMPPGRLPVKTLAFSFKDRLSAYDLAREQLKQGHQVFIVYPVIEDSLVLDISGAKNKFEELKKNELKDFKLGLIHGRLQQDEQNRLMNAFKEGKIDALVATTILEVGIDIPAATCMVIEHAERFGLAQLHQLRGRVGRGKDESVCLLISDTQTDEAKQRIEAMVKYADGFRIAEEDLKIRGPGEFFGQRQHGLSELRIANPLTQMQLLKKSREEAIKLVARDPYLEDRNCSALRDKLLQRFPEYEKLMIVG